MAPICSVAWINWEVSRLRLPADWAPNNSAGIDGGPNSFCQTVPELGRPGSSGDHVVGPQPARWTPLIGLGEATVIGTSRTATLKLLAVQELPEWWLGKPGFVGQLDLHPLLSPDLVVVEAVPRDITASVEGGPYAAGKTGRAALERPVSSPGLEPGQGRQLARGAEPLDQLLVGCIPPNQQNRPA